jgi:hypothetical protein
MERRLHERYQVHFEAKVTVVKNRERFALGQVTDLSKAGISVSLPLQLEPGDQVQVEMADSVLTGHVEYCNPESGKFRIGIEVERVRLGGTGLSSLLQRTLLEEMPGVPGLEPTAEALSESL